MTNTDNMTDEQYENWLRSRPDSYFTGPTQPQPKCECWGIRPGTYLLDDRVTCRRCHRPARA